MRGTIVKRGSRYSVVVELDRDPLTGERRREWHSGFKTKREAEAARIEILGRLQRGEHVPPSKLTVRGFLEDEWLPAVKASLRPTTFTSYKLNVRRAVERIGSTPLQRLTPATLNTLYGDLAETPSESTGRPLSPRTVRYVHGVLRHALADAVRWNRLARNPADLAAPPSAKVARAPKPTTWTAEELRAFLDSVRDDRLATLWRLYASTGLRRGEALGLRWTDVDLDGATLAVTNARVVIERKVFDSPPKSGRGRAVALDASTAAALRVHRARQLEERLAWGPAYRDEGDFVFRREDGSPLHPDYVSSAFRDAVAALDVRRIRLHDLRHTWASLALRAGVNPKVVSERLGHATVSFTLDVYSHVLPGLQEDAAAKVAALIEP
jgi:integrase